MTYFESLNDAVAAALASTQGDEATHLMANKRINGDGSVAWFVAVSDAFDHDFTTHLSDDRSQWARDAATYIQSVWDEEWTERFIDGSVGDFSHGSSSFK